MTPRDLELVAALADGRLSGEERERAVARVESDPALIEVLAETMAALEELEEGEEGEGGGEDRAPAGWQGWAMRLAAVLAVGVLGFYLWSRLFGVGPLDAPHLAGLAAPAARELGQDWFEPGWRVNRGPEANVVGADNSFRLGVRVVDLEVALDAGRVEDAVILTHRIESLLATIELSEPQRQAYRQARAELERSGMTSGVRDLTRVADELNSQHPGVAAGYGLGKWAEAGRLATREGAVDGVTSGRYLRSVRPFLAEAGEDPALRNLTQALEGGSEADVAAAFGELVRSR